ncbi:hypothetical protein PSA7680_02769 [Pseudoruegeria aquimaris]|uniref:DUF2955 domain-containing protein n=1 Tax=Pseudoruegeria aquimaris TaxID=393663 RepID=A0A1Y5T0C1_9RHOB|nr:DUF2955 domain-containing protein [Pseudoruegeria aquimaris]SLN53302.1 hypothetical protein PSA7680_02769 [Pseudoruegeria aquimaris]
MPIEDKRAIWRQMLGTSAVFGLGILMDWPMAFLAAVFTTLFLQAPAALPVKVSLKLFAFAIGAMLGSWILFSLLVPYPVVFLAMVAIAIMLSFSWTIAGAGILPGVLALMAAMMVPNIIVQSEELALALVTWVPANLLIAGFASALCFTLIPAPPAQRSEMAEGPAGGAAQAFDPKRRLLRMTMVTVPFAILFFLSESSALLVLFFVALLSQQLAAMPSAGKTVAKGMLTANLLGAGLAMIFYEINVIAPSAITAILLIALLCAAMGALGKSSHPLAPAAGSAITTVLVVYGGSIAPFSDEADVKSLARVAQIAAAAGFVILAYLVVDEFLPEQPPQKRSPRRAA